MRLPLPAGHQCRSRARHDNARGFASSGVAGEWGSRRGSGRRPTRARRPGTRWRPARRAGSAWPLVRPRSPARNSIGGRPDERIGRGPSGRARRPGTRWLPVPTSGIGLGAVEAALAGPELDGRRSDERIGLGCAGPAVAHGTGRSRGREERRDGDDGSRCPPRTSLGRIRVVPASPISSGAAVAVCQIHHGSSRSAPPMVPVRESDLAAGASAPQA